jgi:large subunit ribosomal protein L21
MTFYAILEVGGQQLCVEPGRFYDMRHLRIDLRSGGTKPWLPNTRVLLSRVLLIRLPTVADLTEPRSPNRAIDHQRLLVGDPWLEHATIKGRLLHIRRADKVLVYKMRPKKKTRVTRGHRQSLARLIVDEICLHGNHLEGIASTAVSANRKKASSTLPHG